MDLSMLIYYKEQRGYSLEEIADLSGVPLETVRKIFRGETDTLKTAAMEAVENVLFSGETLYPETGGESMMLRETAAAYGVKRGNFTLEDYYALPDERRAELLDGVLYDMAAPSTIHQFIIIKLALAFESYISGIKGKCIVFPSPVDVQIDCDDRTMLQPDLLILCNRSKLIRRCIMGAPDLVIEIVSPASRQMDAKRKMAKYATAGVREYWLIDPDSGKTVVYWTDQTATAAIYGPDDEVPVGIFGDEMKVSMKKIFDAVKELGVE